MRNRKLEKICKKAAALVLSGVLALNFQPAMKVTASEDVDAAPVGEKGPSTVIQTKDGGVYQWDNHLYTSANESTRKAFYQSLKPGMAFIPTYEPVANTSYVIPLTGKSNDAKTKLWSGLGFFPTLASSGNDNPTLKNQTTTDADWFEASIITEATPFTGMIDDWGHEFSGTILGLSDLYGNRIGISDSAQEAVVGFNLAELENKEYEYIRSIFADGSLYNFGQGADEKTLYGTAANYSSSVAMKALASFAESRMKVYRIGTDVMDTKLDFILCDDPTGWFYGAKTQFGINYGTPTKMPTLWVGAVTRDANLKVTDVDLKGYFTIYNSANFPTLQIGAFFDRDSIIEDFIDEDDLKSEDRQFLKACQNYNKNSDEHKNAAFYWAGSGTHENNVIPTLQWLKKSEKNANTVLVIRRNGPTGFHATRSATQPYEGANSTVGNQAEYFAFYTASKGRQLYTDIDGDEEYIISRDTDMSGNVVLSPGMTMHVKENATLAISGTLSLRGKLIIDPGATVVLYNGGGIQIADPCSKTSLGDELKTDEMSGAKNPKLAQIFCYGSLVETEDSYIDLQMTMTKTWIDEQHTSLKDTRFSSFYAENANLLLAGTNSFAEDFQIINSQLTIPETGKVIVGIYGKNNKNYTKADYAIFNRLYDTFDGKWFFLTTQYQEIYYYDHTYDGRDHTAEKNAAYNAIYSFLGKGSTSERDREFNMCQTGKFNLKNSTIQSMGVFDFVRKPEVTTGNDAVWYKVYIFPYEEEEDWDF